MIQTLTNKLRAFGVLALLVGFLASCASTPSTVVWLDVRTDAEYAEDHIDGSAHIPHDEIAARVAELGLEKGGKGFFCLRRVTSRMPCLAVLFLQRG